MHARVDKVGRSGFGPTRERRIRMKRLKLPVFLFLDRDLGPSQAASERPLSEKSKTFRPIMHIPGFRPEFHAPRTNVEVRGSKAVNHFHFGQTN